MKRTDVRPGHFLPGAIAVIAVAILLTAQIVRLPGAMAALVSTSGTLDTSLGIKGKLTTNFNRGPDSALSVAVQGDGKIVAAGYAYNAYATSSGYDFALARYNTNGSLDTSFGSGGKVATDFGGGFDFGTAMALQPSDGKIVVAGYTCTVVNGSCTNSSYRFALARYNPDGSLDATFGSAGKVTTDLPGTKEQALAMALQPSDGKIVVAGYVYNGSNYDFALARYSPDGSLDTTIFGGGSGTVTTDFGANELAFSLALQPSDGKIVVAGHSYPPGDGNIRHFALARYNPDGSLDTTFGSSGEVITDFYGGYAAAGAVVVQPPDGKIVAAGYAYNTATGYDFALARYNPDGSLDATFGSGGEVTTDFKKRDDIARGLALQSDGKIVAVGGATVTGFPQYDFALARYNPTNGSLDTSFGVGGKVTTDFNNGDDFAVGVALQPSDGKILAAGHATTSTRGGTTAFGLARYLP